MLKVYRDVNECRCLKFIFVIIFLFGKVLEEVYMFTIANFDSIGSFSKEFMEMLVREVSMEFYFMKMVVFIFGVDGFACYCTESMVMTLITFVKNSCHSA